MAKRQFPTTSIIKPGEPLPCPKFPKRDIYKVLVLPDVQIPFHSPRALDCVLQYAKAHTFDEVVQLGDFWDFDGLGKYALPQELEGQRFLIDVAIGRRVWNDIVDRTRKNNSKCRYTMLRGNHEERIDRKVRSMPYLEGLMDFRRYAGLDKIPVREVRSYPDGEAYQIGKLLFVHGFWYNMHAAKTHVEKFGKSIIHGHTERVQRYDLPSLMPDHNRVGISLGTLANRGMSRQFRGKPTGHQHAFGVVYFFPDGYFHVYIVTIVRGACIGPDGNFYRGEDRYEETRQKVVDELKADGLIYQA
jgi:hypothetical protein